MKRRGISLALAAAVAFTASLPLADIAEARRGRGIAAGVLIGAAALAIAAGAANASERHDRSYGRDQCSRWNRQCDRGSGYACSKFDRHC